MESAEMHPKESLGLELLKLRAEITGYHRPPFKDPPKQSTEEYDEITTLMENTVGLLDKKSRWSRRKEEIFQQKRKLDQQYIEYGCRDCTIDLGLKKTTGARRSQDTYGRSVVDSMVNRENSRVSVAKLMLLSKHY